MFLTSHFSFITSNIDRGENYNKSKGNGIFHAKQQQQQQQQQNNIEKKIKIIFITSRTKKVIAVKMPHTVYSDTKYTV